MEAPSPEGGGGADLGRQMKSSERAKPRTSSPQFRRTPTQRDLAVGAGAGGGVRIGADPATECRLNQRETRGGDIRHYTACSYPEFARSGRPIDGGKRQQRLVPAAQWTGGPQAPGRMLELSHIEHLFDSRLWPCLCSVGLLVRCGGFFRGAARCWPGQGHLGGA